MFKKHSLLIVHDSAEALGTKYKGRHSSSHSDVGIHSFFPNKVITKILGETVLERVIRSVKRSKKIKKIIVATSKDKSDDRIIKICKRLNISYFRGSLENVAKRYGDLVKMIKCKNDKLPNC